MDQKRLFQRIIQWPSIKDHFYSWIFISITSILKQKFFIFVLFDVFPKYAENYPGTALPVAFSRSRFFLGLVTRVFEKVENCCHFRRRTGLFVVVIIACFYLRIIWKSVLQEETCVRLVARKKFWIRRYFLLFFWEKCFHGYWIKICLLVFALKEFPVNDKLKWTIKKMLAQKKDKLFDLCHEDSFL